MSHSRDWQAADPGHAIAGHESVPRGERYVGVDLSGREPPPDIEEHMDTSPRGQLLRFLEHRVFGPILRPADARAGGPAMAVPPPAEVDAAELAWKQFQDPALSAEGIRAEFLAISARDDAARPAWARHVSPGLRAEFAQLCDHLHLAGRQAGDDVRGTDPGTFQA